MINIRLLAGVQNSRQIFSQRINNMLLRFEVFYCSYTKNPYWAMNVLQDGVPIGMGLPLNPGADLLGNQNVGEFGRLVFVGDTPTLDNLGIENKLVWIPAE